MFIVLKLLDIVKCLSFTSQLFWRLAHSGCAESLFYSVIDLFLWKYWFFILFQLVPFFCWCWYSCLCLDSQFVCCSGGLSVVEFCYCSVWVLSLCVLGFAPEWTLLSCFPEVILRWSHFQDGQSSCLPVTSAAVPSLMLAFLAIWLCCELALPLLWVHVPVQSCFPAGSAAEIINADAEEEGKHIWGQWLVTKRSCLGLGPLGWV